MIGFYLGDHPYEWNESSLKDGKIGGTEEAVINISKRLARRGFEVYVFNEPPTSEKNLFKKKRGFVKYQHFNKFKFTKNWELLVLVDLGDIELLKINDLNYNKLFVWLHNSISQKKLEKYQDKVDKYLFVSKWHKENVTLDNIKKDKIEVVENGVNPGKLDCKNIKKNNYYCINTSDPTRGLECLLELWPSIKKEVPKAELHWFYGWESFDWFVRNDKDAIKWKSKMKELIKSREGVYSHGMVSQEKIAEKYNKATTWLYPTEVTETYCISAIKAQYCGAVPVTTNVAALNENVKFGTKLKTKNIYSSTEFQNKFIKETIKYLKEPKYREEVMKGSQDWVLNNNKTWNASFNKFLSLI